MVCYIMGIVVLLCYSDDVRTFSTSMAFSNITVGYNALLR